MNPKELNRRADSWPEPEDTFMAPDEMAEALTKAEARAAALVKNIGAPGRCSGCHSVIWWMLHMNGKRTPYDADGTNHFITCPKRDDFRKSKGESK